METESGIFVYVKLQAVSVCTIPSQASVTFSRA